MFFLDFPYQNQASNNVNTQVQRFKPWLQNKLFPSASLKSTQKLRWQGAIELDLTVGVVVVFRILLQILPGGPIYNGATSRWIRIVPVYNALFNIYIYNILLYIIYIV